MRIETIRQNVTVHVPIIPYDRSMATAHSLDEMQGAKEERTEAYKRYVGVKRQRSRSRRLPQTRGEQLRQNTFGFTLIELLISIVILAFIASFTTQSLRRTMINSKKIQKDVDASNELKAALRLIKTDLRKSFNHRDLYIALYNEAQRERIRQWDKEQKEKRKKKKPNPTTPGPGAGGAPPLPTGGTQDLEPPPSPPEYNPRKERIVTQFLGEKDKVEFSSLNGNTLRKGSYVSDLVEVAYEVKNCQTWGKKRFTVPCLWRRLSYYLDGDLERGGQNSVLLENVTSFKLRYLHLDTYEEVKWEDRWVSSIDGPSWSRNKLPQAVEITLEVQRSTDKKEKTFKKIKMVSYVPIDFVNNNYIKNIIQMNNQPHPLDKANKKGNNFFKKEFNPKSSQGGI